MCKILRKFRQTIGKNCRLFALRMELHKIDAQLDSVAFDMKVATEAKKYLQWERIQVKLELEDLNARLRDQ